MIYFNETVSVPFSGFILQRKVNISILAGNDNITLSLIDSNAVQSDFSIPAGQKMQQRDFDLFRFTIQGSGLAAVALSYPEVIDPSIQVSLNPSLPQSITTPQLPSALDSNGLLKTRYLQSLDTPNRSWNLSSSDLPSRSWNLGSGDTPSRSWNLSSSDTPGKSWLLGSTDVPGRSWNLGSSDVPNRGWTLGSGDTPNRSWNLGSSDTPGKSWLLGSTDNPDVSKNQSTAITTQENLITGMAIYTMSKDFYSANCGSCLDGIQFDIAAGDMIEILEILIMISEQPMFQYIINSPQNYHIPQDNLANEDYYFLSSLSNAYVYLGANQEFLYTDGTYTAPIYNNSTAGAYPLGGASIVGGALIIRPKSRIIYGGSSGFSYTYGLGVTSVAPNNDLLASLCIKYRGAATVSFITSPAASSPVQYQAGGGKVL